MNSTILPLVPETSANSPIVYPDGTVGRPENGPWDGK